MPNPYLLDMLEMLTGGYARDDVQNVRHGREPVTRIGKLFSLLADGFQLVHEQAEKVRLWDNLDNARGTALDRYGANFGVYRNGVDDAFLRLMIKVKMLAHLSGGDVDTVLWAAAELLGVPPEELDPAEVFPAKLWIYVDQPVIDAYHMEIIDLIARVMKRIVAAGVGFRLFLRTVYQFPSSIFVNTGASQYSELHIHPKAVLCRFPNPIYINSALAVCTVTTINPTKEDRAKCRESIQSFQRLPT
ncbi:MAG: hypothetical protein LBJ11_09165 [Oscillospiraceae bacterium]|jgi:hypothetical protein|nr:hypothetical protein [Oscillospiraceae bacterium]